MSIDPFVAEDLGVEADSDLSTQWVNDLLTKSLQKEGETLFVCSSDGSSVLQSSVAEQRSRNAWLYHLKGKVEFNFSCGVWRVPLHASGFQLWWEIPYLDFMLFEGKKQGWAKTRWGTWRGLLEELEVGQAELCESRLSFHRKAQHKGALDEETENAERSMMRDAVCSSRVLLLILSSETHSHAKRSASEQQRARVVLASLVDSFLGSCSTILRLTESHDPADVTATGLNVRSGAVALSDVTALVGLKASEECKSLSEIFLPDYAQDQVHLSCLISHVHHAVGLKRCRAGLKHKFQCLVESLSWKIDLTAGTALWEVSSVLDLPLLKGQKNLKRVPEDVKIEAVKLASSDKRVGSAAALMAGKRLLAEGAKTSDEGHSLKRNRVAETWTWDVMWLYRLRQVREHIF
eukprot:6464035-Amphidinium_carterae.1